MYAGDDVEEQDAWENRVTEFFVENASCLQLAADSSDKVDDMRQLQG
jgi:hypothetical protein